MGPTEAYNANNFALCFNCHSQGPFSNNSDTEFSRHAFHVVSGLKGKGKDSSTDITKPGAGQGLAICAECHYNTHGRDPQNRQLEAGADDRRLINFAPNVQGYGGSGLPKWTKTGDNRGTCTLRCHGKDHNNRSY